MKQKLFLITVLLSFVTLSDQFRVTFENDCFLRHADNDYTHGTGFEYVTDNLIHFKIGQNMYTPDDLTRKDHIVGDRPYAGYLYGGIGYEFFDNPMSLWSNYGELDFGVVGPSSQAGNTQKLIHKWLDCRRPEGWDNQLHDEFTVTGQWWTKYNWFIYERYVALVPRVGTIVGTLQDAVEIGVDLRLGWNIKKDVGNTIMLSGPLNDSWINKLTAYVFAGVGERYYLYNHFYEGSLFNNKDKDLKVDIEPFVSEFRFGAFIQYDKFFITYYGLMRTDEFKHQPNRPDYGGISFGLVF